MSVAASRPPSPVVAPSPLPAPTPADREPDSPRFAELLRQSRGVERRPAEAPKATTEARPRGAEPGADPIAASDETTPANDSAAKSDAGRARTRAGATATRSAARTAGPVERSDRGPERMAERGAQDDDLLPADASSAAANPHSVRADPTRPVDSELRFGAAAHGPATAATAGNDVEADAARTPAAALDTGANRDAFNRQDGVEVASRSEAGRGAARPRDADAATSAATSFARDLADARAADRPASAALSAEPPPLLATALAAPEPRSPAAADSTPLPPTASLPVAVDSPEFAAAFGVQVSVFVREGVQHAELHLNPVETGPVSIAITLEGSQAHVEFGADLAATRQAIENGLPALASALRDAGFTLAGGGVAQHSRSGSGRGEDDPAGQGRHGRHEARGSAAIASATVQRATHRVAAGGIDLYA